MVRPERFCHQIPLPEPYRSVLDRLAGPFGTKAEAVEAALSWGIRNGIPASPDFPSTPQVHVHLSTDYRSRFTFPHIGTMLAKGLDMYRTKNPNGIAEPPSVWYKGLELPLAFVRSVRFRSFSSGRHPDAEFAERFRSAVDSLLPSVPVPPSVYIEVPTDSETRKLYRELASRCYPLRLDPDTLLVNLLARSAPGET